MSATRPYVDAFADAMEAKLAQNRHKGDHEGWIREDPRWLFARLREEVDELARAAFPTCGCRGLAECNHWNTVNPDQVLREAADVANFAMMIADVAGGLKVSAALAGDPAIHPSEAHVREVMKSREEWDKP